MKKIKISFENLKLGPIFLYLMMIVLTSLVIVIALISLPLTEELQDKVEYNLVNKDNAYWSKEYILELETSQIPEIDRDQSVSRTKSILAKRLNKAGVEEFSIFEEDGDEKKILRVYVTTSQDAVLVDNLVQNRFLARVVTRKEDVDFEDAENEYAYLLGENYNTTEFTMSDFRNVLITELRTSSGEYSYFAVFKPWINRKRAFDKFLKENEGENIGLETDGFVTPYFVPETDPKTFAISISGGESQSKLMDLLYNSGEIPVSYTTTEVNDLDVESKSIDYIKLSAALLTGVFILYTLLLFVMKEDPAKTSHSLLSTILSISTWITYLKLSSIPVDIWVLAIECVLIVVLVYVLANNIESQMAIVISMALSFIIFMFLGTGYMRIFGREMILALIVVQASIAFSKWYISNMKKVLER